MTCINREVHLFFDRLSCDPHAAMSAPFTAWLDHPAVDRRGRRRRYIYAYKWYMYAWYMRFLEWWQLAWSHACPGTHTSGFPSGIIRSNWNDTEKISMAPAQGWHAKIQKCMYFWLAFPWPSSWNACAVCSKCGMEGMLPCDNISRTHGLAAMTSA